MKKIILTGLTCMAASSLSHAATVVTSSSFTGITIESDLDNSGSVVSAVNYDSSTGSTTINGITFTNDTAGTGGSTNAGVLTTTTDTAFWSSNGSTVDAFDALMDGHIASGTNQGGITVGLSLSGLNIGQEYTIQILSGDASLKHTTSFYRSASANGKTEKLINQQVVGANGDLGGIFTATFISDDGDAFFTLERSGPDNQPVIAGYALTTAAVPEPSSTALLGLGGIALILRRRK